MNEPSPTFAVVIPLHNKVNTIERTLQSVFDQTVVPNEIIVVDDGSTDASADLAESILRGRPCCRLIRQDQAGVSVARNRGVTSATTTHALFLDADDLWRPNHVSQMLALVQRFPDCGMSIAGHTTQGNKPMYLGVDTEMIRLEPHEFYDKYSRQPGFVHTSAVSVCRRAFTAIGGFLPGGVRSQDIYLWLRMGAEFATGYCSCPTSVKMVDSTTYKARAAHVPCFIEYFSPRIGDMDPTLLPSLRRILIRGAFSAYLTSAAARCDLSKPLAQALRAVSPCTSTIFRLLSLPGIRTASIGIVGTAKRHRKLTRATTANIRFDSVL